MKVKRSHLNIALVVLAATVLYTVWNAFRPAPRPGAAPPPEQPLLQTEAPQVGAGAVQAVDPLTLPAPPAIDVQTRVALARDPFLFGNESRTRAAAAVVAVPIGPEPRIASILFSPSRRAAVVDGRIVSVGDTVGAFRVADIEKDAVVFTTASGERRRVALRDATLPAGLTR